MYIQVKNKFFFCVSMSFLWAIFSFIVAQPWINELGKEIGSIPAHFIIMTIAIIPGLMNAFLVFSLLCDKRPKYKKKPYIENPPPISIIIAAYNEEKSIMDTFKSLEKQNYKGAIEVIIVNDGSTDKTETLLDEYYKKHRWVTAIHLKENQGKSHSLNHALKYASHDLVISLDADSYLFYDAISHIVMRFLNDPDNTAAVAGAILSRNSRKNLMTKIQEWDYFHGISAVKRFQSLFQGTLVAQGAFSIYRKDVLTEIGGWKPVVGEDIVLTWDILSKGHRVGFAENAYSFTNVPDTVGQFYKQRQRWARGLIEAFKTNWRLLFKPKYITFLVWWNLLFPVLDLVYTFVFLPGIILAFFGHFYIVGPMTVAVLPLGILVNIIMYKKHHATFIEEKLKIRRNISGFIIYSLFYGFILQPAALSGYIKEFTSSNKQWGTK